MTGHGTPGQQAGPLPLSVEEYAERARALVDPGVWDFIEGGAGAERTLAANRRAFDRVRLRTRVLTGNNDPDPAVTVLGRRWAAPVGVAPMAYHTLMHPDGEIATARAAGAAGLPVVVSTFAGRAFEDIAAVTDAPLWLQVYCFRDRDTTRRLIERAERAGFEALVLTVDTPRLGRRLRDLRNDFRLPSHIRPANLPAEGADYSSPSAHSRTEMDPALDWSVIAWMRSASRLPVLVKGVLTAEDAERAVGAGVDGIVVSNHGGRQLDGAVAALDALAEVAPAVRGRCALLVDGGVRGGADVLAALALGADAVLLGRPVLHGLAVAGGDGVHHVLGTVVEEFTEAMALTGTPSAAGADPALLHTAPTTAPAATAAAPGGGIHAPTADGVPAPAADGVPAPTADGPAVLRREDLHASLSDPVLDTMNFLNEVTGRFPEAVSFAPGRPYEEFLDTEEVFGHIRRYLDHLAAGNASPEAIRTALYQYGPTAGQIRELIADSLRTEERMDVPAESVVVTVGAQEAMLLVLRALFAGPQDVLLVASPCYVGITGAAALLGIPVRAVQEREDGIAPADVEAALRAELAAGRRPRAFYVVPDHANPTGRTMPERARVELLAVAARYGVLVVEDNPYRMVSPGPQLPTLKALDTGRLVVHLGSYSKSVFPGARVGFVVADQTVRDASGAECLLADELAKIKSMVTVNTPALSQAAVAGALLAVGGRLAERNARPARHYGEALRVTLEHLAKHFPGGAPGDRDGAGAPVHGVTWNEPSGGFFLSVRVPFAADNEALMRSAREFGVIWTPMAYFYPEGGGDREIRLSFSYLGLDAIEEGVARLAAFIRSETERATAGAGSTPG